MTRAELLTAWRTRAVEAEKIGATAPVSLVYRAVIGDLEELSGVANVTGPDRCLTLQQAAERLGVSVRWLSEPHNPPLPFIRKLSRRMVRVSEQALTRWLESQRAAG